MTQEFLPNIVTEEGDEGAGDPDAGQGDEVEDAEEVHGGGRTATGEGRSC